MTWSLLQDDPVEVKAKFIMGNLEPGSNLSEALEQEQSDFGDILHLPVDEGYHNLVNKSIEFFRWYALNGTGHYVMKLDDDTFPSLDKIVAKLHSKIENGKRYTYAGDLLMRNKVLLWGKWAQNPAVYNKTYYPVYASGPGYLLGRDLVEKIFIDNFKLHSQLRLDNEDANVGVWVHQENLTGITVDYSNYNGEEEGCRAGVDLAMNLVAGEMECMWAKKLKHEKDFCCDFTKSTWMERNKLQTVDFLKLGHRRGKAAKRLKDWEPEQDQLFAWRLAEAPLQVFSD